MSEFFFTFLQRFAFGTSMNFPELKDFLCFLSENKLAICFFDQKGQDLCNETLDI